MGTLTNMTQRHDANSVSSPPATRPMAPPAAETVVKRPMARTRSGALGEERREQGQRRRRGEGGADALEGPGGQQHPAGGGQAADQGADREQGDADEEDAAPAEEVTGPGPEEEQAAEGEDVGVEHPGQPRSEKPRPRWMWGRATLTMVVSSTTMSWAVRITNKETECRPRRRGAASRSVG